MSAVKVTSSTQRIVVNSPSSITVIPAGPLGPRGLPGEEGEPGAPGTAPQSYHHIQNDLSDAWPVNHNLHYKPALTECKDDAGTKFLLTPDHVDNDNLILHFPGLCRGTADFA